MEQNGTERIVLFREIVLLDLLLELKLDEQPGGPTFRRRKEEEQKRHRPWLDRRQKKHSFCLPGILAFLVWVGTGQKAKAPFGCEPSRA